MVGDRKMKVYLKAALAGIFCFGAYADQTPPTLRLPETAAPVSYKVALTLDPAKDTFSGEIEIKLTIKEPEQVLWLNGAKIQIQEAVLKAGGKTFSAKQLPGGDDFVGLDFTSTVPAGSADLDIKYSGSVRQKDNSGIFHLAQDGNNYLYTQFEAIDARAAFPCFDEPSYKVPWQLTLTVPSSDTAVSNTPIATEEKHGDQTVYTFKQTKPLPSYLVAFGVGPFDYVDAGTAGKNHFPVRIVTPKGHADEAKYAAEVTATILTRLENYFGIPFPYDKSDQIAIPVTGGFGAMENPGLVTYGQTIILAKPATDTTGRQRSYASVAAHELAHQWFGDLVTTAWWNDIWLNEAFATWMEEKILREWKPEWQTSVNDVSAKLGAEEDDSLLSARKIRQEIKSKEDIGSAFDGITYQKGAAVISMFENYVGAEPFRKGVQSYLKQYAFKNATAPEFLDAISTSSKTNVTQMFSTFLNQAGVPMVSMALDCKQGQASLHLEQQRFVPLGAKAPADQSWQIPLCVRYGSGVTGEKACQVMTQSKQDWALKGTGCPAWVEGNDQALGYYRVDYQGGLLAALTAGDVEKRLSAPERADIMGNVSALAGAGKMPMGDALLLAQTFAGDPERHVAQSALLLALEPVDHEVPPDLMPNYQRFLEKSFGERARQIGWTPKPGEADDVKLLRPTLLRLMSTYGGDKGLAAEGIDLALGWFTNHASVDPNLVGSVLTTAAYYGDKTLFERFLAELKKTKDLQDRSRILQAMAAFRDPASLNAGFEAILSDQIPLSEGTGLLFSRNSAVKGKLAFAFLQSHYDEFMAKRASEGGIFEVGSFLPFVGASFCDASSKAELQSFFAPKAEKLGANRSLAQALEGIDDCIAKKAAEEPSVTAFLAKY
jgi:alanyl aminopeptidase